MPFRVAYIGDPSGETRLREAALGSMDDFDVFPDEPSSFAPDVFVIGPEAEHPIATAQRSIARAPTAQVLFLLEPAALATLRAQLPFLPRLASAWTTDALAPAETLASVLGRAASAAVQRAGMASVRGLIHEQLAKAVSAAKADATEIVRLRQLAASEDYLATLLLQAPDALVALSLDGTIVAWNAAAGELLGRPAERAIGRPAKAVLPEALHAGLERLLEMGGQGHSVTAREVSFVVNGAVLWAEISVSPVRDNDGAVSTLSITIHDVTRRRTAELRVRESESRLRTLTETLPQLVWTSRPDGVCDYLSPQWVDYTGIPEAEQLGSAWLDLVIHPDDRQRTLDHWLGAVAERHPYDIEYRIRGADGAYRWFKTRGQAVRDERGAIVHWFGTCTDIQDIVEARELLARDAEDLERRVEERTHQLRDAEDFTRLAMSAVGGVGAWTYDVASDRFFCDPQIAALYALDPSRIADGFKSSEFLANLHPDDVQPLRETMAGGLVQPGDLELEYRIVPPDGSTRWVLSRGHTYFDETGTPTRRTGVGVDITSQRLSEEQLRQSQKMEAIGQLTGGVAHDFNNLLTIIRSSVDFLRRRDLPEVRRERYIQAISETVDRAATLTQQLLAFARRQPLKPTTFEVVEQVRAVIDLVRPLTGARIDIVGELDCADGYVTADTNQFDTALLNLAVNARDAMSGEGRLTIRVGFVAAIPALRGQASVSGDFIAISVSDTGTGIDPANLSNIFEPFYTTKDVGKGTGLGLSQVFGFAKQSGGDVGVASEPGRGSTFTIYLRRVAAPEDATAGDAPEIPAKAEPGLSVLLVEDNEDVGAFATEMLSDLGYRTTWAANGAEALALLERGELDFDVVFSDVMMPGMTGIEMAQRIRARHPGLPVVLTSGYSTVLAEEGRHGFELLQKPYSVDALSRVLRKAAAN